MKKPARHSPDNQHRSFGIKHWLMQNGFHLSKSGLDVNHNEYADVLERFYLSKGKKLLDYPRWEFHAQMHFEEFKKFVKNEENL